jgi:hypothetical protein
MEDLPAHD